MPSPEESSTTLAPPSDDGEESTTEEVEEDNDPLADVPELVTYAATDTTERVAALKLIADSIAQQRQIASRAVIYSPITLAAYIATMATTSQVLYRSRKDLTVVMTTCLGLSMAFLMAAQWATVGYLRAAESISWGWLRDESGKEDLVVVTRWGKEIIGSLVVRLVGGGKKAPRKAIVRGWSVRLRFRGKGVGGALLEEGIKIAKEKLGGPAEVVFADDHASESIRPSISPFPTPQKLTPPTNRLPPHPPILLQRPLRQA
jgi:hypothetical protein